MNKTELIAAVAEKSGLTKKNAEQAINATLDVIVDAMKANDKVQLVGFGTFEAKTRAARTAVNPQTGKKMELAPSRTMSLKVGKTVKDALNS